MKTLAFGSCHLRAPVFGRLMKTMLTLFDRLNPGMDFLLIDNASPIPITDYLPGHWIPNPVSLRDYHSDEATSGGRVVRVPREVMFFDHAIGHFHHDRDRDPPPRDGPGRATMTGLRIAMNSGYDRAVYMETDCLFFRPLEECFAMIQGKPVALLPRCPMGYLDTQAWFVRDLAWLRDFRFIEKYDWPNRKGDHHGEPVGELIYEQILGEHLEVLPLAGCRLSAYTLDATQLPKMYPDGRIDFLTHAPRAAFAWALEQNGHGDLVPYLIGE